MNKQYTPEQKAALVKEIEASKGSKTAAIKAKGLTYSQYYDWKGRYSGGPKKKTYTKKIPTLVSVTAAPVDRVMLFVGPRSEILSIAENLR